MKRKLKLLAASDLHGDSRLAKKLAERAHKEKEDLIKPFKDKNKPVLIIPGNWDSFATTDFIANVYGVKNIHGYSAIYENVGFFGAGGADGPGPGRITEKELFE